ncbi:deoxynucleotide monophosphate kinase [Sinorhizobium meliloti]|uniref:deoxynucleotide monophosphate kinase family protein n=1 Tax=Rhizobium meliloti TaxID=382 RepID=UPI000FD6E2AD|nr:deoxynucleotide monophosphate kinase [Sinorhizobium meliloti]RVO55119.1 deoxynucleotide monophosphate kinase [Sinorhizobium meliloti]
MIDSDNWSPWLESGDLTHVPTYAATGKVDCYTGVADGRVHAAANDNYPRLVALTGAAGSGKSTATRFLVERHGYTLVKFAGPLKDMLRAIGFSEAHIEGELKEQPDAMLGGKTPRFAMQTLGAEWGRSCIGDDFWVNVWRYRVLALTDFGNRVVVDDCRFPNEAGAVRQLGGMIIKLEGRGGIAGQHASEAGCGQHDAVVTNDGGVVDLYASVEQEVRKWAA